MANLMTGAEIVFKVLEDQGGEHIFGYPGGAVLPIYDELKNHKNIKHILVRHEQGAGHAAEGYARSSGKPCSSCNFRTRSNKCGNRIDRCLYGFSANSLYNWSSTNASYRNRCFSRM